MTTCELVGDLLSVLFVKSFTPFSKVTVRMICETSSHDL